MSETRGTTGETTEPPNNAAETAQELEFGARHPGRPTRTLIWLTAVAWSLFQIWIASPLADWLDVFVVSDTEARSIHLAFAIFLAYLLFPAIRPGTRHTSWPRAIGVTYALGGLLLMKVP